MKWWAIGLCAAGIAAAALAAASGAWWHFGTAGLLEGMAVVRWACRKEEE